MVLCFVGPLLSPKYSNLLVCVADSDDDFENSDPSAAGSNHDPDARDAQLGTRYHWIAVLC